MNSAPLLAAAWARLSVARQGAWQGSSWPRGEDSAWRGDVSRAVLSDELLQLMSFAVFPAFASFGFGNLNDLLRVLNDTFSWESFESLKEFATVILWGEDDNEDSSASSNPSDADATASANTESASTQSAVTDVRTTVPIVTVVPTS